VFYVDTYIYIHGRWVLDTITLKNKEARELTYGKADKRHKFLLIEKVEEERDGKNVTMDIDEEGIIGLQGLGNRESYA
jgi:hypothetical protein